MEQQDLLSNYRKDLKERILVTSMRAFKERGIRSVRCVWTTSQRHLAYPNERYMKSIRTRKSCCSTALYAKTRPENSTRSCMRRIKAIR